MTATKRLISYFARTTESYRLRGRLAQHDTGVMSPQTE